MDKEKERRIIERLSATLKGLTFPLVMNEPRFMCGKSSVGYIVRSDSLGDRRPVCDEHGLLIAQQHYKQGRHIVIVSPDRSIYNKARQDFEREAQREK